jgi:hypothetical protein
MMTASDVAFQLAQRNIKASRDRVARLADAIWGRQPTEAGRHRRFSEDQIDQLAIACRLSDRGLSRSEIALVMQNPSDAAEQILADAEAMVRALRQLEDLGTKSA